MPTMRMKNTQAVTRKASVPSPGSRPERGIRLKLDYLRDDDDALKSHIKSRIKILSQTNASSRIGKSSDVESTKAICGHLGYKYLYLLYTTGLIEKISDQMDVLKSIDFSHGVTVARPKNREWGDDHDPVGPFYIYIATSPRAVCDR